MVLGVIGGLGPMATVYFMQLVVKMTKAQSDQEHLGMVIYNSPDIPDRTEYILGKSKDSPLPMIVEIGKKLKNQGISIAAMPCITAHYFQKEIEEQSGIQIVDVIGETAVMLKSAGVRRVGIMATDGTIQSELFQKELIKQGLEVAIPDEEKQKMVMSLIYDDVKKNKEPDLEKLTSVRNYLVDECKAQAIILGCTELSVIKQEYDIGTEFCDAMEVLAKKSILMAGKEVNSKYDVLFTPVNM